MHLGIQAAQYMSSPLTTVKDMPIKGPLTKDSQRKNLKSRFGRRNLCMTDSNVERLYHERLPFSWFSHVQRLGSLAFQRLHGRQSSRTCRSPC